jgi:hypothetical protein
MLPVPFGKFGMQEWVSQKLADGVDVDGLVAEFCCVGAVRKLVLKT